MELTRVLGLRLLGKILHFELPEGEQGPADPSEPVLNVAEPVLNLC